MPPIIVAVHKAIPHRGRSWIWGLILAFGYIFSLSPFALAQVQQPKLFEDTAAWHSQFNVMNFHNPSIPKTKEVAFAWGDVNGDGDLDLAMRGGFEGDKGFLRIYLNQNGTLQNELDQPWVLENLGAVHAMLWNDVENDGDLDMVIAASNQVLLFRNQNGVLPQTPDPTWRVTMTSTVYSLDLGDLDGDGDPDLVAASDNKLAIYRNQGGALFATPWWIASHPSPTRSLAFGDADADGDLDLAVAGYCVENPDAEGANPNKLYHFNYTTQGLLEPLQIEEFEADVCTDSLVWVDVNQDGALDLSTDFHLFYNTDAGTISLTLGKLYLSRAGQLSLTNPEADLTSNNSVWGDINRDGNLDLVDDLGYIINQPAESSAWHPIITDTLDIFSQSLWFDVTPALGDMNGDGLLDVATISVEEEPVVFLNHSQRLAEPIEAIPPVISCEGSFLSWGDVDRDGDLDLAFSKLNYVNLFRNVGGQLLPTAVWTATVQTSMETNVWGDVDGNGDLDLLVAGTRNAGGGIFLYLNRQGSLNTASSWSPLDDPRASSIALGDIDQDGDLDLATAGNGVRLYLNQNGQLRTTPAWLDDVEDYWNGVAWGDLDGDGDLDLAVSGSAATVRLYRNDGVSPDGTIHLIPTWQTQTPQPGWSVAVGDVDGDGALDLATNSDTQIWLYRQENGGFVQETTWQAEEFVGTLAWNDVDGDGDLDLTTRDKIFINQAGSLQNTANRIWTFPQTEAPVWGDINGDGLLDRASVYGCAIQLNLSQSLASLRGPARPNVEIAISPLSSKAATTFANHATSVLAPANHYAVPAIRSDGLIPISYTVRGPLGGKLRAIHAFYSLDGGDHWLPATATPTTLVKDIPTHPTGIVHSFVWDVGQSAFFGASDNVILRIEALPPIKNVVNGTVPRFQIGKASAQTFPFRVRGTQVRVVDARGKPLAGALVYRLPAASNGSATLLAAQQSENAFQTDSQGYLSGRGALAAGDQLVALTPISATHAFTLYYSSAAPTGSGLAMTTVSRGGVQTLTVSADHPLILLNLDISLEWDARNDESFLQDLQAALRRTSATLFDVSEGQVALGTVRLFQNKEDWLTADGVVYASNSIHPRATMGGVVLTATNDIGLSGIISNAYLPGQVRMGPLWDPFGQNQSELSQDWSQALAHELSHYFFFLPDNYLGIQDGQIKTTDCRGSFMTNTYDASYSEFLTRDGWVGPCLDTVATHLTGRTDWETITRFMPWLHSPTSQATTNAGPATLPLQVINVQVIDPAGDSPLSARNYDLRSASNGELVTVRQAHAYLFKTQGTSQLEDDRLIALGTTGNGSDRIQVRGAERGDRLCMIDSVGEQVGCTTVDGLNPHIDLTSTPGWQPVIEVSPVSSRTLTLRVTQPLSPGMALAVQILPAYGSLSATLPISAPWTLMIADRVDSPNQFSQTLTLPYPAFEGFVRVWLPDQLPAHEAISEFFLSAAWGPNPRGGSGVNSQVWGPNPRGGSGANPRAWGANHRSAEAPVASGDGHVTIFDVDDILADSGTSSLQALATLPGLSSWLTPVGQGYRFLSSQPLTRTIAFHYLSREVPPGYEHTLNLYYLPDGESTWLRLPTLLDTEEKLATAPMPLSPSQGEGVYALVATLELPRLLPGWNQFGYPLPQARAVSDALASVAGSYQSVYELVPDRPTAWQLYDPAVANTHPEFAALVNDLQLLQFGHVYWINATKAITPYLDVAIEPANSVEGIDLPPATFYGGVNGQAGFVAQPGMVIAAYRGAVRCGEGKLVTWQGAVVYKIQLLSKAERAGCGETGAAFDLFVEGQRVQESLIWNNHFAHFRPVHVGGQQSNSLYLPIIAR
ncbi:MAG: VCBS repeat-containing protein [Caldilineaceae bacterium]